MVSMFRGFNDLGMDDFNLIHQVNNPFEDLMLPSYATNFHHHSHLEMRSSKQIKINNNSWNNNNNNNNSSAKILSFGNSNQLVSPKEEAFLSDHHMLMMTSVQNHDHVIAKKSTSHHPSRLAQAKEHIIAERKRRQKLSQRFIALSAMVPDLKKMDKASVLEDAIKYLKRLQDRVKTLEEKTKKRKVESSTVLVKRSRVFVEDEDPFLGQETLCGSCSSDSFPGIEARFSNKDVLIRIHCEKKNGIIEKLIAHIESLNLMVINSSTLAFGSSALDVTIIAQMEDAFSMTAEDLVRHLHIALI